MNDSKPEGDLHIREDDLELYAFGRLDPSKVPDLQSHLETCDFCRGRLEVSSFTERVGDLALRQPASGEQERRYEIRIPTNDPAVVRILDPEVGSRSEARILDTSKNGLRLEMTMPVDPGAELQVQLKDLVAFAQVRYCRSVGEKFHVGVKLIDVILLGTTPPSKT